MPLKKETEHLVPELIKDIATKAATESKNGARPNLVRLETIQAYIAEALTKIK